MVSRISSAITLRKTGVRFVAFRTFLRYTDVNEYNTMPLYNISLAIDESLIDESLKEIYTDVHSEN